VIGGGHPNWISGYISTADYNALRDSQDYNLVERIAGRNGGEALLQASERAVAEDRKLFGLFGGRLGCFDPPVPHNSPGLPGFDENEENPSLAEATLAALTVCAADPDGFFLMIEQGDLDWSNHYNDYHWMIGAMWSLEEAVRASIDFVNRPGDDVDWDNTTIIVTADHATGGLRLLRPGEPGIGDLPEMNGTRYHYSFPGGEVDWLCTQHTNELVPLYATGGGVELFRQHEGSWYPGTRIIDNTQVFEAIAESLGISDAVAR
jgi:alkaline phosphatase